MAQMLLRSKLDRVYDDRLSDHIPEDLWTSKSAALQEELRRVRTEMERHEVASQAYETAGLQILELAQTAYSSYVAKNPHEQARLIKTLVSNSTFDRGSLSLTYVKPFDVFAKGSETGDWLLRLDSEPLAPSEARCRASRWIAWGVILAEPRMTRRTGRFPQLVDPRSSVNGLFSTGSPRFRDMSFEERRSLAGSSSVRR